MRYLQLTSLSARFGLSTIERKAQGVCSMGELRGVHILGGSGAIAATCWQNALFKAVQNLSRVVDGTPIRGGRVAVQVHEGTPEWHQLLCNKCRIPFVRHQALFLQKRPISRDRSSNFGQDPVNSYFSLIQNKHQRYLRVRCAIISQ